MKLLLTVFLVGIIQSLAQDATKCGQYPTCHECISHNLCGWCGVPVVYNDGSTGPYCAGKPEDPNNPPPGYKPWTCPMDFQNDKCYGYLCNENYQCVSAGSPGKGVPLADCQKNCIPPTYECNTTTTVCFQVLPGHGTDKSSCEAQCQQPSTTTTGGPQPQTPPGPEGPPSPDSNTKYTCNISTLTCESVSGGGGMPKTDCDQICSKPNNVTPVFVIGEYRGLEINKGYLKGEWQARITADGIVIVDATGKVWKKGVVRAVNGELWLVDDSNEIYRGLYSITQVPELQVLTWALAQPGQPAPSSYDNAMQSGIVMVLGKCLVAPTCQFHIFQSPDKFVANKLRKNRDRNHRVQIQQIAKRANSQDPGVNDPCSKYPDCHSCVIAPEFCGWCSVPILYNSTIPGKNCAGLNTTITPRINCTGIFSTEDCSQQTTGSTSTADTTSASTASTAGPDGNKYSCDPVSTTCVQDPNGSPKDVCDAQCKPAPIVPPILQNTLYRGLEIDNAYIQGEWRAKFTTTDVTILDPSSNIYHANVTMTAQYMTLTFTDGSVRQTLWQLTTGASSTFLSWAWGSPGGPAPDGFDDAMTSSNGAQVHWFSSCLPGKPTSICDFSQ